MKTIGEIDRNLAVSAVIDDPEIRWIDPRDTSAKIYGLLDPKEKGPFRRTTDELAEKLGRNFTYLHWNTTGGRLRFVTDSPYVAIHAEMLEFCRTSNMTCTGLYGFDMYVRKDGRLVYKGTFVPPVDIRDGYESRLELPNGGPWEVCIHFPLCNRVDRLLVGLKEGSVIAEPTEYAYRRPVVFYGSSITQGVGATRPGMCYEAIISRRLDCDYVNIGLAGSALGEDAMADYLAGLDMSVFVCDYDHNAPDPQHLENTHEKLYRCVRERQPDLPIIFVTKPDVLWKENEAAARRAVIRRTYETAISEGDRNVAFIDGASFFEGFMAEDCTVDNCHPNDLGYSRMAKVIGDEVEKWLKKGEWR